MPVCKAGYNVLQLLQWVLRKQRTEQLATTVSFLVQGKKKSSRKIKKNKFQGLKTLVYSDLNK